MPWSCFNLTESSILVFLPDTHIISIALPGPCSTIQLPALGPSARSKWNASSPGESSSKCFKNGPNKENVISKHRIKFPLFFHLILGQREQDPLHFFIIILKRKKGKDLNLNPENPSQEQDSDTQPIEQAGRCKATQRHLSTPRGKGSAMLPEPYPFGYPTPFPTFSLSSHPGFSNT